MEIEIDAELTGNIVADEHAEARREIAALGPVRACERSQARHDTRLADAPDAKTLACKAGCYWCCYFSVDVRPVEILRMLEFVQQNFSAREKERLVQEVQANSKIFAELDDMERMRRNIKCPFLVAGRCSIYTARPQTCRNYHATDAAGCQRSFEEPDNFDIEPEFAQLVYQVGGAHADAFCKALQDEGYDIDVYEINTALAIAMQDPQGTQHRFEAKEPVFPALQGTDVPFEFIEEDD